ncbi:MAG: radical SAM protein, partial [Gemmatimonadaceae bacterium]
MLRSLRRFAAIARTPVLPESAALHARNWARVPGEMRTPHQMLGRQGNGCGATIGAMPRCDFACRGCYLGEGANRIPAEPVEAIKAQMRQLRPSLGASGNLQLTDGEITLRPDDEVIELIRYARELELIPMLMTHGDSFRRRPGLLERYMTEGGLSEVSIHVDTTQRGRTGAAYKRAESEDALNPLRDEFARMIRHARRDTGLPLRAATTVTVTRDNLAGIPDVTRWVARNSDAFRMISFQPVAQVGRTEERLGAITVDELWAHIAEALYGSAAAVARLERGAKWLGHPACNRIVHGVIVRHGGDEPAFHPIRETGDAT